MSDLGLLAYYLGIEVTQTNDDISIKQFAYTNKILKEAGMIDCYKTWIPMDPGTRLTKITEGTMVNSTEYRSLIGCLRYLLHTRPDLSYSVGLLSRFMQEPREQHMKAIRQVLRYVKGTKDYGITYKHNGGNKIHGYSDSSYGYNTPCFWVIDDVNKVTNWSTQKQATVALSSCESEFIAATAAATQTLWLKRLLSKLTHSQEEKVTIQVDNKSAISLMKNLLFHGRSKHIDTNKLQCYKCKKIGHIAPKCPQKTKPNEQSSLVEEDLEQTLLMAILEDGEEQEASLHEKDVGYKETNMVSLWYLDNRASNHVTGVGEHFKELDEEVSGKVYFLTTKDQAFDTFKEYKNRIENELRTTLKMFRTDRGGEFTSSEFTQYCKENSIARQLTAPYSPQQNGVVERRNRKIMSTTRCMMKETNMPQNFWAEAVRHAIYILNSVPTKALEDIIPYEAIKRRKPNLENLRVFGCIAYAKVPLQHLTKLDDRSTKMVYLGNEQGSKAYRLFDPTTQRVCVSRDVKFKKDEAWDWKDYRSEHINDEPVWTNFKIGDLEVTNKHHDQETQPIEDVNEFPNNDDDDSASPTRDSPLHSQTPHTPSTRSSEVNSQVTPNFSTQSYYQSDNESIQITDSPSNFDHTPVRGFRTLNDLYENTEELLLAEDEPRNYKEASSDQKWIEALKVELDSINRNNTWELTTLPKGHKAIGLKWEEVYVTQPEGFIKRQDNGKVYRLIKALYRLRQAPRAWNIKLDNTLKSLNFKKYALEQAIYTKTSKDSTLLIGFYVDDLIITGTPKEEIDKFKAQMEEKFKMSDLGLLAYYLGIELTQTNDDISIKQAAYTNKILKEAGMINCNETWIPMDPRIRLTKITEGTMVNSTEYRSLIGCLIYLLHKRPDLSYSDYGITYKHNGGNKIHGYSDSSYGVNTQEEKGTTGIIFYYGESPISWSTQKQATIALSSCESEFIAATAAATQALWLKRLLSKLTHSQKEKVTIQVDNKSAISLMKNPLFHGRSKHIDTKYHFIRECVEREDIQVKFVNEEYHKADILIKALPKIKFLTMRQLIGKVKRVQPGKHCTKAQAAMLFTSGKMTNSRCGTSGGATPPVAIEAAKE
nr:ribonuclease H-like domain, reverse transcriptase, RNA-dependent DNA polymerase [Tanacetum cinerariifolium]